MNFLRKSRPLLSSFLKSKPFHHSPHYCNSTPKSPAAQFYTFGRQQPELQHFRRHSGRGGPHWYKNPTVVVTATIVSGAAAISIYYGNLETVPYTKRTHFILVPPSVERQLGESEFEKLKAHLRHKILPSIHPDSVRVRLIAKDIIDALHRGLDGHDRRWSDLQYSESTAGPADFGAEPHKDSILAAKDEVEVGGGGWIREEEVLDDRWVQESRQVKRGAQSATRHLEGLNWEVVVVRDGMVNALCLPGGKIIVFTGLLDHFRSDPEIACILGHEIGHAIARHAAEGITKNFWLAMLQLIVLQFFYLPDVIGAMSNILLRLPFSRKMEMEADYIGLLLMASAGYDPRVAPRVYEKLGEITGDTALKDYLSTHPSSKKRAQLLSQAQVMEEALRIYRESIAGRGVAGFL